MSLPTTPPSLAPPQLYVLGGGGRGGVGTTCVLSHRFGGTSVFPKLSSPSSSAQGYHPQQAQVSHSGLFL